MVEYHYYGGEVPSKCVGCRCMVSEVLRELIPESKQKKLLKEYEEMKAEIERMEQELRNKRAELREKEKLLAMLGLIERPVSGTIKGEKTSAVVRVIKEMPVGQEFTYSDLKAYGFGRGIVWRVLRTLEDKGVIEKVAKGTYKKVREIEENESGSVSGAGSEGTPDTGGTEEGNNA